MRLHSQHARLDSAVDDYAALLLYGRLTRYLRAPRGHGMCPKDVNVRPIPCPADPLLHGHLPCCGGADGDHRCEPIRSTDHGCQFVDGDPIWIVSFALVYMPITEHGAALVDHLEQRGGRLVDLVSCCPRRS